MENTKKTIRNFLIYLLVITISIFITLQEIILRNSDSNLFAYFDEAILLLAYATLPFAIRKRSELWILFIPALPILSLIHATIFSIALNLEVRTAAAAIQSLINFKFFLYFLLFNSLYIILDRNGRVFAIALYIVVGISGIGYTLNIIYPNYFNFSDAAWHLERDRIVGFQFKPNDLALLMSFFVAFLLFSVRQNFYRVFFALVFVLLIAQTGSRTGLALSGIFLFSYLVLKKRHDWIAFGFILSTLTAAFFYQELSTSFFFSESVLNVSQIFNIEDTKYVRALVIYYGFYIAALYFPLGAGAASYGTVMSAGSPVYAILGLDRNPFFEQQIGIYDSGLAAVAGEYGAIGITVFFVLTYKLFSYLFNRNKLLTYTFFFATFFLSAFQPFFSYQVNSLGLLLVAFSIRYALIDKTER